ncbi:nickel ABC transporter permease subunit NikC [Aureimonas fodinaquatilis]|uniref:Nickel ABC transporter permease subunit NikC n=1 Tax=Aureimonas fodinaquatilis TaxID=2565783 RepID=A0A5B0E1L4_9HYPH|nr:nickel ABC transporter permease subunit NikC [Aureimonas fodinaquatilis]KAA0972546.1 nickel ABC transporter permease subunit NikC [Aureimonas fodinaquatilis]
MSDLVLNRPRHGARKQQSARWPERMALAIIGLLALTALFGSWLTPYSPQAIDLANRLQPPDSANWLGTDHLGRDILSRLIEGAGISLGAVAITLSLIVTLGIVIGGSAGFIGGRYDQIVMRITDIFLTFPTLVLALFLIAILGTGLINVIIAITLSHWAWYARIVRGIVLSLRHREFVLAARMAGAGRVRIFVDHLLPATLSQLVVLATLDIGHIMLHISALSFIGLGVAPPAAEWGVMMSDARQFVWTQPLMIFWPGLALFISVMAFNRLGDAMRDRLDPALMSEHQI